MPNNQNQIIETANARISVIPNDIFYVLYNAEILLEKSDFIETRKLYVDNSRKKPLKILIEFPKYTSATDEARNFAENTKVEAIAGAVVFKTLAQRILVRSYYLFNKQEHPVKIFTSKEKAVIWLNSM